jgi:hypothetical protein
MNSAEHNSAKYGNVLLAAVAVGVVGGIVGAVVDSFFWLVVGWTLALVLLAFHPSNFLAVLLDGDDQADDPEQAVSGKGLERRDGAKMNGDGTPMATRNVDVQGNSFGSFRP